MIYVARLCLVLGCAAVLGWATLRASAAWHFFAAETITANMYEDRSFSPDGLDRAEAHLEHARARIPNHPDYLDLAGHLRVLRAGQPGVVGRERRELLESAARDYRAALAMRPLWPYSWVNLLSVKDKLGQVDAEFNDAMQQVTRTGPWEPRPQLQLVRIGVRWWDQLTRSQRELVRETLQKALRVQPREVFEVVRFYARPDLLCDSASGQPQIERWCGNVM